MIGFAIYDTKIPSFVLPASVEVNVEIYALGFRELKPAVGWLPVNKAFLKIDLRAITFPGETLLISDLSTHPCSPGPNPNLGAVLTFKCKIPKDPLYCPSLSCNVYDYLMSGVSQPMLGTFSIELNKEFRRKMNSRQLENENFEARSSVILENNEKELKEDERKAESMNERIGAFDSFSNKNDENKIFIEKPFTASYQLIDKPLIEDIPESAPLIKEENKANLSENDKKNTIAPESSIKGLNYNDKDTIKVTFDGKISSKQAQNNISPKPLTTLFTEAPLSLSEAQTDGKVVIMPQFKQSDPKKRPVEIKLQNKNYFPLGYNRLPEDGKKHYRYILPTSLEKSDLYGEPPFQSFQIKKGQSRGLSEGLLIFSKKTTQATSTLTHAGTFKGLVRINHATSKKSSEHPKNDGFEKIAKLLVTKTDCLIRVYIIDALDLVQKDIDSPSDPYIKLKLGKRVISDRDNYILDDPCPKFNKVFELNTSFPGESTLKVQVWDYDNFLPDDKIGTTKIDLEDRFFSET